MVDVPSIRAVMSPLNPLIAADEPTDRELAFLPSLLALAKATSMPPAIASSFSLELAAMLMDGAVVDVVELIVDCRISAVMAFL